MSPTSFSQLDLENDNAGIPDGFIVISGPDGQRYLVPEFLVSDLNQTILGQMQKKYLGVEKASGSVRCLF
jgi:hypothetical protein